MTTPLQQAAQAILDYWDAPASLAQLLNSEHIYEKLRKVLDAELAQSVEPAAWVSKHDVLYSFDDKCAVDPVNELSPLYLHPPRPQATYSDSTPLLHVGNSSFEDWFQERDRAGKSDKQLAREAYAAGMGDPLVTYAAAQGEKPQATTPRKPLTDDQVINAMCEDGCERIESFYFAGPVQKAAVWSFARAIEAALLKAQGEKPQATTPAVSNDWLIRKEPNTKDKYYVAEGKPPANVLEIYEITGEKP